MANIHSVHLITYLHQILIYLLIAELVSKNASNSHTYQNQSFSDCHVLSSYRRNLKKIGFAFIMFPHCVKCHKLRKYVISMVDPVDLKINNLHTYCHHSVYFPP